MKPFWSLLPNSVASALTTRRGSASENASPTRFGAVELQRGPLPDQIEDGD
jgi:hypothetical protein